MYYSENVKKAMLISFSAHKDDLDKGGYPYMNHPFFIAFFKWRRWSVRSFTSWCLWRPWWFILYPLSYIKENFNENVYDAVKALIHDNNIPYLEYVKNIKNNPIAKKVKLLDLKHNLDASSLNNKESKKKDLYLEGIKILES